MNKIRPLIYLICFIYFPFCTYAQETLWGECKIEKTTGNDQLLKVSFGVMNDFFYLQPGEKENAFVIGNDHYKVIYKVLENKKAYLEKILAGEAYMTQENVRRQNKTGFSFSDPKEGLENMMKRFPALASSEYHPEYFKPGLNKEKTHVSYLELLGDGNAYYGQHNLDGEIEGIGTYVTATREKYRGPWKDGIQEGKFIVTKKGVYRAEGHFVNGKQNGVWKFIYEDQSYHEQVFDNGTKKSEQAFFEAHNKSLKGGLDNGYVYKSVYTEKKVDGVWNSEFPYEEYYFRLFSNEHRFCRKDPMGKKDEQHIGRLIRVEERADKRVEYYDYTFLEKFGHTQPVITIYKNRQKKKDGTEYNIQFYFPHHRGEINYHFLKDEQTEKEKKEFNDTFRELQKQIKETKKLNEKMMKKSKEKKQD